MLSIKKLKSFIIQKLKNELDAKLSYHGVHHTLEVLRVCDEYISRFSLKGKEAWLIRSAALLHDVGITETYSGHEEASVQYAKNTLSEWGYEKSDLKKIEGMILATKIPQKPANLMEKIICDADLDYLGTKEFYEIGDTLFKELIAYEIIETEEQWDRIQIKFLLSHSYHTNFAIKHREPMKQNFIKEILNKWKWEVKDFS
ncbi:MAG: HD domain-containing protein [Saprospiraceae bacterium]|nr:HD domain-containing protein [Saprospiraceae bacterium]MBK7810583.1 HD domain-containing protein [Saprospiraceae bacterium]MBK9630174.1 HD domain-containing protein [Saprospiraceae bacterium]